MEAGVEALKTFEEKIAIAMEKIKTLKEQKYALEQKVKALEETIARTIARKDEEIEKLSLEKTSIKEQIEGLLSELDSIELK
jgi:predicted  nucleic acid-binding Zn-ribbon protein